MLQVPPEAASGEEIEKFPAVAALCFVLASLDFYDLPESGAEQTHTERQTFRDVMWQRRTKR
jgi:hypothetical protein